MAALFSNNAVATLASGITAISTSLVVTAGQGAAFPAPSAPDYFYATLVNAANTIEIVKVTARATDAFTIERAQEGTTAVVWNAGDKIELRITAAGLNGLSSDIGTSKLADAAVTTPKLANLAVTAAKIADATITSAKFAAGAVASALGFTPVRQTGSSTIEVGYSSGKLPVSVASSGVGNLLLETAAAGVSSAGYRGIPLTGFSDHKTMTLSDNGTGWFHNSATVHTFWVPAFASVAFEQGATVFVHNYYASATLTVAGSVGVTLVWADTGATGNRFLAAGGVCTVTRIVDNVWVVSGAGLS